jgi:hypothetical protein
MDFGAWPACQCSLAYACDIYFLTNDSRTHVLHACMLDAI